jgi:hypothetical protein
VLHTSATHASDDGVSRSAGKTWYPWATTLIAALLFATTTAAAFIATTGNHAPIPALWKQDPPSIFNKGPEGAEYRELLF